MDELVHPDRPGPPVTSLLIGGYVAFPTRPRRALFASLAEMMAALLDFQRLVLCGLSPSRWARTCSRVSAWSCAARACSTTSRKGLSVVSGEDPAAWRAGVAVGHRILRGRWMILVVN